MTINNLSDHFCGIAAKRLSAVETDSNISHQHEFNGVKEFKRIFGQHRQSLETQFIYLGQDSDSVLTELGSLTWYDAREAHPIRSEYRLYYSPTSVTSRMTVDDLIVIGQRTDGSAMVVVAKAGTTAESQIRWLFKLDPETQAGLFAVGPIEHETDRKLNFASRFILSELNVEINVENEGWLERIHGRFGERFPNTTLFSAFARETLPEPVSAKEDPDGTLMAWLEHEEMLFRTLEQFEVAQRLESGFDNVDVFINYSLSIQNRRKSRIGYALEHHVEQIVEGHHLAYTRGGKTEGKSKPDFIFPSIDDYHNSEFPPTHLAMLGVKSSCKERWRQVLAEARRIETKHLLTLEPGISQDQTTEMKSQKLQLVLPQELHETYLASQQTWLWNMQDFLKLASERQGSYCLKAPSGSGLPGD